MAVELLKDAAQISRDIAAKQIESAKLLESLERSLTLEKIIPEGFSKGTILLRFRERLLKQANIVLVRDVYETVGGVVVFGDDESERELTENELAQLKANGFTRAERDINTIPKRLLRG